MNKKAFETDEVLIRALQNPETCEEALRYICKAPNWYPPLEGKIISMGGQAADAEDAFQEGLLILIDQLEKFRGESKLRTFFFSICINRFRKKVKKHRPFAELPLQLQEELKSKQADEALTKAERLEQLKHLFNSLLDQVGEKCKKLLIMQKTGLSVKKIFQRMEAHQNIQSTKNALQRCRDKMRKLTEEDPGLYDQIKKWYE